MRKILTYCSENDHLISKRRLNPGVTLLCLSILIACNLFFPGKTYQRTISETMTAQVRRENSLSTIAAALELTQEAIQNLTTTPLTNEVLTPTVPLPSESPQPGLLLKGQVSLVDGTGLAGVNIYRSYASYPGTLVAITDENGYYRSEFQPIPGDEMVSVWAELSGYIFLPSDDSWGWEQGTYYWRHYYGYEEVTLDFIAEAEE